MSTFEDFVFAFPPEHRMQAGLSERLADAYWKARRAGWTHDKLAALAHGIAWADNPIGVVIKRLRDAVDKPPQPVAHPRARAGASTHLDPHKPCPDAHPGCVLCGCYSHTQHHVAVPMPDWFKSAWRNTVQSTVIP